MEPEVLWSLLRDLARRAGVEVRLENLGGGEDHASGGGLCRVGGRMVAFVDRRLPPWGRTRQLGRALNRLDLAGFYLKPALRQFLSGLEGGPAEED